MICSEAATTPALSRRRFLAVSAALMASAVSGAQHFGAATPTPPPATPPKSKPGTAAGARKRAPHRIARPPSRPGTVMKKLAPPKSKPGTVVKKATPPKSTPRRVANVSAADMYDVTQYGATGDGVTDDTAAIQAAIDAVLDTGGTVFFPPGTYIVSPMTDTWIGIKSNLHITGASNTTAILKISDDNGDWQWLLAPPSDDSETTNFTVDNLGFDANIANQPEAVIDSDVLSTFQCFVHVAWGSDLHVTNCSFVASGVWVVALPGMIDNCSITNNVVNFTMHQGQPDYDNSCFYVDGTNYTINGNTFTTPIGYTRAAIETHGGPAECAYNRSTGFQTLVNVVGQWGVAADTVADINIHDNTVVDSVQPIRIQPMSPANLVKTRIRNNTLGISQLKHLGNDCSGIEVLFDLAALGSVSDLQITGNTITFQDYGAGDPNLLFTENWVGIGLHNLGGADNVVIDHNTIVLAPGPAIRVGLPEPGARDFSRVRVTNNTIVNPGQNLGFDPFYRDGILVSSSASSMTVSGNTISETFPTPRMVTAIAVASGYAHSGMSVTENSFNGQSVSVAEV